MRSLLSFILIVFFGASLFATDYYSQGNLTVNLTTSWKDSNGFYPPNFTTANNRFIVQNGHSMTASALWTVSGSGSYVVIQNGGKITTGPYNHQITGAVQNGGTYEVTHTTYSNLGWGGYGVLEANSNFILNNASINFIDTISYGNLTVQNGSADVRGSSTGFEVKGELKVQGSGTFSGGLTEDQTLSIGNINITGGYFYGSEGSAVVTYNISGNVSVSGGYFYGSEGSGACIYNISGNLTNSGGFFYAVFRSSSTLPYNSYTIGGNFTVTTGNYSAVNTINGGYPSYYLTGTGKTCGIVNLPNAYQAYHMIYIQSGASYTQTNNLPIGTNMQLFVYGTLDASTYYIVPVALLSTIHIYGTLRTSNSQGFSGLPMSTIPSTSNPTIDLGTNSTIDFNASSTQYISARTDYRTVLLNGGTKNLNGNVTIATQLTNNADLNIASPNILTLNGALSSSIPFGGTGHLYIGGSSAQLLLPACNVTTITLSRPNGLAMISSVQVTNLNLTNGIWSINGSNLTLYGLIVTVSGSLAGGPTSMLSIEGAAASLAIPSSITSLYWIWLQRADGCSLSGDIELTNLFLAEGTLTVGAHSLSMHGNLDLSGGGVLSTNSTSSLHILSGSVDFTLPPLTLGNLEINRSGYNCIMTGSLNVNSLGFVAGNLSIGSNTLLINVYSVYSGGTLTGGDTSNLIVTNGAISVNVPAVTLLNYTQRTPNTVNFLGQTYVYNLSLVSGNLHLVESSFWLLQGFQSGTITPYTGVITGTANSQLHLSSNNLIPWQVPDVNVGSLYCNLSGGCVMSGTVYTQSGLMLENGPVDPNGHLTIAAGSLISRNAGYLTAQPDLGNNLGLYYLQTCTAGFEMPAVPGYTNFIQVAGPQVTVTVTHNAYLNQMVNILPECVLDIQGYTLFCQPFTQIIGQGSLFGNVQIDIGMNGLNALPGGIKIEPGVQITGFNFSHYPYCQQLNAYQSINRTWTLYGEFGGTVIVTYYWPISADNGLDFSHTNLARVYRWADDYWLQVGNPVDVSMLVTRAIQVPTTEFSMWTVGTLAPLAVPFVLDFETGWKDCKVANAGQVNHWCTGTDAAYRNTHSAYVTIDDVTNGYNPAISALAHFYVDVRFPDDMTNVRLRFEWKGEGEPGLDYLSINLINTLIIPMSGIPVHGNTLGIFYGGEDWQLETINIDPSYAGQTMRLVFSWINNAVGGEQPPIAIDNIRIVPNYPPIPAPVNLLFLQEGEGSVLSWDIVPGANDYKIQKADDAYWEFEYVGLRGNPIIHLPAVEPRKFFRVISID
jgi:hypothetical protein